MRWSVGYFGAKDLFTIVNLFGGVGGIYFAAVGNLAWAGYSIFLGYALGDALDGPVARATNTANRFGSEFDSAADHLGQGIAPAVIVFVSYRLAGLEAVGLALMAFLMLTASIRQARFNVEPFRYPLCYCGLPRTISGLVAVSLPNATLFHGWLGHWGGAMVLAAVGILNLCPIPYMTHKGTRGMQTYVKLLVLLFFAAPVPLLIFAPQFAYDFLFFMSFGYAVTAWIPIHRHERGEFWQEYRRWSHEVTKR